MPGISKSLVPIEQIDGIIHTIRGVRVMLDRDLAQIYGVPTFRFNEAIKRNRNRFPLDFMFQLTREEFDSLRIANCDLKRSQLIVILMAADPRPEEGITLNEATHRSITSPTRADHRPGPIGLNRTEGCRGSFCQSK